MEITEFLEKISKKVGIPSEEVIRNALGLFVETLSQAERGRQLFYLRGIPPGYSFKVSDATKRSEGEWHSRWEWELFDTNQTKVASSDWRGFDSMQEALSDLSLYFEENPHV